MTRTTWILVADAGQALGLLRQCATSAVLDAISGSIDHDWTQVAVDELPARLARALKGR